MKKIILFFCDITGTLIGQEENSINDYKNFNQILLNIAKKEKVTNLIFSLVSYDDKLIINNQKDILNNYFDKSIIFGKQFFGNGYSIDNKIYQRNETKTEQILRYISETTKNFDIVKVYYADDCEFFHMILSELIDKQYSDIFISIIPKTNKGLNELNSLLEHEILNNKSYTLKMYNK